ncbi:MAG: hypothetical protein ACFE8L_08385 [Candidatus Hodarchaeota archaeon]
MTVYLVIVIILSLLFGVMFFVSDYYGYKLNKLHASLIAGISVSYFFLVVLPEIGKNLPEFPFHSELFEYLFVLIGFSFIHISEKLILQKVESKTQKKIRKLIKKEKTLEAVEENMEDILTKELTHEKLDEAALKDISQTLLILKEQEVEMKNEIETYKIKIQNHISKELTNFRYFTDYIYHFLIGLILVGLLSFELVAGILFFIFAWFRTIITKRSEAHIIFTDLEIYETIEHEVKPLKKYILATSALVGILISLILKSLFLHNLELLFIFFSFISGVILYLIVREVIPEKEKGDPIKFVIGLIGFTILIFILNTFKDII